MLRFFSLLMLEYDQLFCSATGDYRSLVMLTDKAGVQIESIGNSSGRLEQLF